MRWGRGRRRSAERTQDEGAEAELTRLLPLLDRADGIDLTPRYRRAVALAEGMADEAEDRQDLEGYCVAALALASLSKFSRDPSAGLRPAGMAYLTALLEPDRLRFYEREALDRLVWLFHMIGEPGKAADCAAHHLALTRAIGIEPEEDDPDVIDLFLWAASAGPDADQSRLVRDVYLETGRAELPDDRDGRMLRALLDEGFGVARLPYLELAAVLEDLVTCDDEGEAEALAHRGLAAAAHRDGRIDDAVRHSTLAIRCTRTEWAPWFAAAALGQDALMRRDAGDDDGALAQALACWGSTLGAQLHLSADVARRSILRLASTGIDVALDVACRRRDWRLLTELIENTRLQAVAGTAEAATQDTSASAPRWILERLDEIMTDGLCVAALEAALSGDARSLLGRQVVATCEGRTELGSVIARMHGGSGAPDPAEVDVFEGLGHVFDRDGVAWWATARGATLYWTLSDAHGPFDGGAIDLDAAGATGILDALNYVISARATELSDAALEVADPIFALADPGGLDERLLLEPLARLVPEYVRLLAASRAVDDPLPLVFALPPQLSSVPFAILPIGDDASRRLVEGVELQFATTTAIRAVASRPDPPEAPLPLLISCSNPTSDLEPSEPVPARVLLDGDPGAKGGIAADELVDALLASRGADGVLVIRSHSAQDGTVLQVKEAADHGIAFADGVLSARRLVAVADGQPLMPRRVVLALCSGAGSAADEGLALGLAAVCRSLGAREVLTSIFNVPDQAWSNEFDFRLADAATRNEPLSTSLRALQLEALGEWKVAGVMAAGRSDDPTGGPSPLVWASYGVFA